MAEEKFREFIKFVEETGGRKLPTELADSFKDIFIYVPSNKTPPKTNFHHDRSSSTLDRTISIQDSFTNRNQDFLRIVREADWNQLEYHLGTELIRFCFDCIFAKKTKQGAFMVSNLSDLRKMMRVQPPTLLNQIFYKTAVVDEGNSKVAENVLAVDSDIDKLQIWENAKKNLQHLFTQSEMQISTDDMLFRICITRKFPLGHVLVKKNTNIVMSMQVVDTCVGRSKIVDYESCVEPLEVILKKLKKLHNKYHYEKALSQLVAKQTCDPSGETTDKELQLSVLKMFFTNICRSVIPKELFGSNKNTNTVIKIICDLLETTRYQSISLRPYIMKMRPLDMHWLKGVTSEDARWSILGKLLKWIFTKFILEIFRTKLYIMVANSSKKIYFMQKDWQKLTIQFLRKMRKDKIIANVNGLCTRLSRDGRWTVFPKKNGMMRPIMSGRRVIKPETMIRIALSYLQQLCLTKYGESGKKMFHEKWRNFVDNVRNSENKTSYVVSCDIQYAYGSIIQKKLMHIVKSLANLTGPELKFQSYNIVRNFKTLKQGFYISKKWIMHPDLELPIASKSIFARGTDKVVKCAKEVLIREIERNVINQNVLVSGQRYLLQEGIAQGAILSSALCDIYYAHMEEAHLSQFKEEGFLYRYVDDILFATKDKASAERFLVHVNEGFPDYKCSFNAAKTKTNLPGHKSTVKDITYLGYNINLETLEVMPEYSQSARYTTVLSNPGSKIIETFRKRLLNTASLKLDDIVLDCKINSQDSIIQSMERIFMRQAERCLWLLKALFDDVPSHLKEIFGVIKSTNLHIIRRIQRYFLAHEYDFEKLVPHLAVIPWKSYRQAFAKMPTIGVHFRSLFLITIKRIEHAVANCKIPPQESQGAAVCSATSRAM